MVAKNSSPFAPRLILRASTKGNTMLTKSVLIAAGVGLAGLLAVGFPVVSVARSGADAALSKLGPGVNADVIRDEIEAARGRLARAGASIAILDRQVESLRREMAALDIDIPDLENRLRRMGESLTAVGRDSTIIAVNGRNYERLDVEMDLKDAMDRHRILIERRADLPEEIRNAEAQLGRLRAERAEAFSTVAAMMRRIDALEAQARIAEATAAAAGMSVSIDRKGIARRIERYQRHVDEQRALAEGARYGESTRIRWGTHIDSLVELDRRLGTAYASSDGGDPAMDTIPPSPADPATGMPEAEAAVAASLKRPR